MLSKVFVNIKVVLQNHFTQCLYWLNFFSEHYVDVRVLCVFLAVSLVCGV